MCCIPRVLPFPVSVLRDRETSSVSRVYRASPGRAAYIGDLRVVLDRGRFGVAQADNYQATTKRTGSRLAAAKLEPVKALMQPEVLEPTSG